MRVIVTRKSARRRRDERNLDAPRCAENDCRNSRHSCAGTRGAPRRTVAIIGAGMAGVSVAWLLDGQRDVVLLESRDSIGGNVRSLDVELDGHQFAVDLGAQFFHPGPYPVYTALLESLDLFPPDVAPPSPSAAFPASITIEKPGEATPRFVSPIIPTRLGPSPRPGTCLASWRSSPPSPPRRLASRTTRAGRSRWATGCRHSVCRRSSGKASSCRGRRRCFRATSSRRAACPRARPCCSRRRRCPTIWPSRSCTTSSETA